MSLDQPIDYNGFMKHMHNSPMGPLEFREGKPMLLKLNRPECPWLNKRNVGSRFFADLGLQQGNCCFWPVWARSRRNPGVEAVVRRPRMAMAGLYSGPAIFH